MASRQAAWAKAHRAAGLCVGDSRPVWRADRCFECTLKTAFSKRGLLREARRHGPSWRKFVAGMAARYERILNVEGFMIDAVMKPEDVLVEAGMKWARYKKKKKVLEIIWAFDDRAIREKIRAS